MRTTINKFFFMKLRAGSMLIAALGALVGVAMCIVIFKQLDIHQKNVDPKKRPKVGTEIAVLYFMSYVVTSILMFIASWRSIYKLLIPWMICHGLICVVLLVGSIAKVSLWFFLIFPLSLLLIYCLVAVWSLYRKLKPKVKEHTTVPLNEPNHDTSIPIPGSAQRVPYPVASPNSAPYPPMPYPQANSPPYPTAPGLPYPVMPGHPHVPGHPPVPGHPQAPGHPHAPVFATPAPHGWQ